MAESRADHAPGCLSTLLLSCTRKMKVGAYTVTLTIQDQPLAEYKIETDGSRTECWIASEEGKVSSFACSAL